MHAIPTSPCVLGLLLLSACAGPLEEDLATEAELAIAGDPLKALNGGNLNGGNLNGGNLNGEDLSNFVVSVNFNPSHKGAQALGPVSLRGTTFQGDQGGVRLQGTDFVGVEFQGNLGDGGAVRLRITGMNKAPAPNTDLDLYSVQYLDKDLTWKPACHDAAGTVVQAIPVAGVWDYRQNVPGGGSKSSDAQRFTFACLGGAIAKCTLFGYRPWSSHNGKSLEPYHQACTRLVRADYCGTGEAHTSEGSRINLYDPLGIQQDTENWLYEASWDVNGARCFYAPNRTHSQVPCYNLRQALSCGLNPGSPPPDVLLHNETPGLFGMDPGR